MPAKRALLLALFLLLFLLPLTIVASKRPTKITSRGATDQSAQEKKIYVFDSRIYAANNEVNYDYLIFLRTLQGIVNKNGPSLYIIGPHGWGHTQTYRATYNCTLENDPEKNVLDIFWLNKFRQPGEWLADYQVVNLNNLDEVITTFKSYFPKGVVVWDRGVPATVNVATTVAGVEDTPVVRYDPGPNSLYHKLTQQLNLPVFLSLASKFTGSGTIPDTDLPSTGSIKNDPYIWAVEKYLKTGKTNPQLLGYFEDSIANTPTRSALFLARDYLVQNKAFVFDLVPYPHEVPCDDPNQSVIGGEPLDYRTFKLILQENMTRNDQSQFAQLHGFIPWFRKYSHYNNPDGLTYCSNSGSESAETNHEGLLVELASRYNAYLNAHEDGMAPNISFHSWAPIPERLIQNPKPLPKNTENKTYLSFTTGDFEGPDPVVNSLTSLWDSRNNPQGRGSVPIAYNVDTAIIDQIPDIINYFYQTKSTHDYFISNVFGLGYIYPNALSAQGLSTWRDLNSKYNRRLNYSITGYGLDRAGPSAGIYKAYRAFSGDGMSMIVIDSHPFDHWVVNHLEGRMPFIYSTWVGYASQNYRDADHPTCEAALDDAAETITHRILREIWCLQNDPNFPPPNDSHFPPDYFPKNCTRPMGGAELGGRVGHFQNIGRQPNFVLIKIVWPDSYELYDEVYKRLQQRVPSWNLEAVDIYTFFYLYRQHLGGNNNYRATFVSDNLPSQLEAGKTYSVSITVRNDGWDTWQGEDPNPYVLASWFYRGNEMPFGTRPPAECQNNDPFYSCRETQTKGTVAPGQQTTFTFEFTAAPTAGDYTFHYDMAQRGVTSFQEQDNLAYEKMVKIVASPPPTSSNFTGCLVGDTKMQICQSETYQCTSQPCQAGAACNCRAGSPEGYQ